jgi:hypothetical protein
VTFDYPTSTSEITPLLIETALKEWGDFGDLHVRQAHTSPVGDEGEVAQTVRVVVEWAPASQQVPSSLIAKFASSYAPMREMADLIGAYRREVRFYAELAEKVGIPAPRCYFAGHDPEHHTFLLLLEDLGAGRVGSLFTSSVEDAREALTAVAGMHARWWRHERLAEMRWLGGWSHPVVRQAMVDQVGGVLPTLEANELGLYSPYLVNLCRSFLAAPERLFEAVAELPATIIHGDFHPQNVFFAEGDSGRFAAFDWQLVERGFAGYDVARMLSIGLRSNVRQEAEASLLDAYEAALRRNGVDDDFVQAQYDIGILANLMRLAPVVQAANPETFHRVDPTTGERFSDAVFGRLQTIAEERNVSRILR